MVKENKPKKFSLTEEEKSNYFFNFRLMKEYQEVAQFWADKLNWIRVEVMKRESLDTKKYDNNWDSTLEDGTFTATPKELDSNKN
jgi:hypothetical protein